LIGDAACGSQTETVPTNPAKGILRCNANLAEERKTTKEQLLQKTTTILIGTTLPTNCILEEKGAKCCLIHTKGFRDVYELGRTIPKVDIYNLKVPSPKVLIPRYLRFGVEERIQYDGKVVTPLNEEDVLQAVKKAKKHGVEIPVAALHSYINPNMKRGQEIIKKEYPNVVISSNVKDG
jgi:N-methylhydantoinase A